MGTSKERSEKGIAEERRSLAERIQTIEKTVAKNGRRDLDALAKAGIDRQALLGLLARAATEGDTSRELAEMRRTQAALKSLSRRLLTLGREAADILRDPRSAIPFWTYAVGGGRELGMKWPEGWWANREIAWMALNMGYLAGLLNNEAGRFGRYTRAYGRRNFGVVWLLVRCWMFRIKVPGTARFSDDLEPEMDCLAELARLLTDAFEAAGTVRCFSEDGLRQTFRRHGRRLIRLWEKIESVPPKAEPTRNLVPLSSLMRAPCRS